MPNNPFVVSALTPPIQTDRISKKDIQMKYIDKYENKVKYIKMKYMQKGYFYTFCSASL